ncbi:MAG TPA: hypothetical protein VI299_00870, partial [Polyangiales bacterium]
EFRAWVAQLATFLLAVKQFFDQEQKELALWDHDTQRTVGEELLAAVTPDLSRRLNAAAIELGELAAQIPQELEAEHRAFIQSQLNPYLEAAPFIWRVKHKPLGYAGDYEMMNMLYRDHREGDGLFAKALNVWATSQPAARANINRIEYIGSKLQETIRSRPEGVVRVASIGCGPAQEIYSFLKRYPELGRRLDIALIDQEEKAIDYCERSLAPLAAGTGAHIRVIKDSARRLLTDRRLAASLGECDLLYSAGLFDYLAARSFSALLATLYGALAPDGVLLIGNVAQHNPDRAQMEYIGEWYLHHRSPDELLALAGNLQPVPKRVSVDAEPTGVNLFLVVER